MSWSGSQVVRWSGAVGGQVGGWSGAVGGWSEVVALVGGWQVANQRFLRPPANSKETSLSLSPHYTLAHQIIF